MSDSEILDKLSRVRQRDAGAVPLLVPQISEREGKPNVLVFLLLGTFAHLARAQEGQRKLLVARAGLISGGA